MSTPIQITIVGLGLIGASFGLALKRQSLGRRGQRTDLVIVGHDKAKSAAQSAQKMGAIDNSHWNLLQACEKADLILLALPATAIAPTLQALAQDLKPGCLLLDTAPIKTPILQAAHVLPDSVYFVGGNPIVIKEGRPGPAPDLFDRAPWALCPTPATSPDAVAAAADIVSMVGARPFFLDAAEHDGLMGAVDGLPLLLAAALMNALGGSPSWRELHRLASSQFETATYLPAADGADLAAVALSNRANVLHWLDLLLTQLQDWRQDLADEKEPALIQRFTQANDLRSQWLALRASGDFEEGERSPELPSVWSRFLGQKTIKSPRER